jgi:hypothetical protein
MAHVPKRPFLASLLVAGLALAGCSAPTAAWRSAGAAPTASPSPTAAPEPLDLANATIDLPKLPHGYAPCEGRVTFHANQANKDGASMTPALSIEKTWVGDVNHDGTPDTVAYVYCHFSELVRWQVVALQAGPGTTVRTIGQVVADYDPATFFDLTINADNDVVAEVGDYQGVGVEKISLHQKRTYRWNGSTFTQVAGGRTFPPNPNFYDLTVSGGTLSLGPAAGYTRPGTLTLTVQNRGPGAAHNVVLTVPYPDFVNVKKSGLWSACTSEGGVPVRRSRCTIGTLAAGQRRTLTYTFSAPTYSDTNTLPRDMKAEIRGEDAFGFQMNLERSPANDTAKVSVTRA